MAYNLDYIPGSSETVTGQEIDAVAISTPTFFEIEPDEPWPFILADVSITDGSTTLVLGTDYTLIENTKYTAREAMTGYSGKTIYSGFTIINATYAGIPLYITGLNFGTYTSNNAVRDYLQGDLTVNSLGFSPGRTAFQELTSGTLSTSGWYTIAEDGNTTINNPSTCDITMMDVAGGILGCKVALCNSSSAKSQINATIELIKTASSNSSLTVNQIESFRVAKSDSVSGAGFKIQAYLNPSSSRTFYIQLTNNFSRDTNEGFNLVTPYLDDTPTLPDGVTPATFIEAGAEFQVSNRTTGFNYPIVSAYKVSSDDQINVTVIWPETPKQGSSISLSGFTAFRFKDPYTNTLTDVLGSYTISSFAINGNIVSFTLNQIGIATGITTFMSLLASLLGSDGKLTIED